ncbi:hypothetical protein O1611_g10350 [Lasiodiplodia mahajangana]|uniref:Uncharacterized protein n=1 Tax=Lasiodiplodia mahajangana TaxID=1108764 RepID=A0ACC2IZ80_9PEZI|nr:hypothetical protein O1611_g10350 [Lasiodiplodia mahajangana]
MGAEDRKFFVNYFHDFYIDAFSRAKTWGRNLWSGQASDNIELSPHISPHISPRERPGMPSFSPNSLLNSPAQQRPNRTRVSDPPTRLCNWSIHVAPPSDDPSLIHAVSEINIIHRKELHEQSIDADFSNGLRESIIHSSFTRMPLQDLPIAHDSLINAVKDDPEALELDAWKLAIMAGNAELLEDLYERNGEEVPEGLDDIYPLHLAAAFLDGGHACCKVFEILISSLGPTYAFNHNIDKLGHTILDAIMTSILRSHTTIVPEFVNKTFSPPGRFPGEEMDICGRWSPESPKIRSLFHGGFTRVPSAWKHPFCHTAVQAVCHSLIAIYGPSCAPDINRASGLFIRRCTECGLELKLGPLHTLVVVAFSLAQYGTPGETLFGAIAVLVCLLSLGADTNLKMNISAEDILGASEMPGCSHTALSPSELAQKVPVHIIDSWTDDCRVGWICFTKILSRGKQPENPSHRCELGGQLDKYTHGKWLKLKCQDAPMGLLWATIQTEMLTYRRINEGDSWMSENFSLRALEAWVSGRSAKFDTPLVADQMMRKHTKCGWFPAAAAYICATAQEVSASYFMNMDAYERSTYLGSSDLLELWRGLEIIDSDDE